MSKAKYKEYLEGKRRLISGAMNFHKDKILQEFWNKLETLEACDYEDGITLLKIEKEALIKAENIAMRTIHDLIDESQIKGE